MNLKIILSGVKTIIILLVLYYLSCYISILRLLFTNRMISIAFFQYLLHSINNGNINVNELPYVGGLFIMIDSIILSIMKSLNKN